MKKRTGVVNMNNWKNVTKKIMKSYKKSRMNKNARMKKKKKKRIHL